MTRVYHILLIGVLSMFYAEVFSGASQAWFAEGWGLFITLPLYLFHVLFFLSIALMTEKPTLSSLYILGMIFGLYESWITKVLWAGYFSAGAPAASTFLGVGIFEFPILVFFWHPVMSFILPVLTYQLLTGRTLVVHDAILRRSQKKSWVIAFFLILIASFIANGNQFSLASANVSVLGSLVLIFLLTLFSTHGTIEDFHFERRGSRIIIAYLVLLYVAAFFLLLPDRIPSTLPPYLTIVFCYLLLILLFRHSAKAGNLTVRMSPNHYNRTDLLRFSALLLVAVNVACLVPAFSGGVLIGTYLLLSILGTYFFVGVLYRSVRKRL